MNDKPDTPVPGPSCGTCRHGKPQNAGIPNWGTVVECRRHAPIWRDQGGARPNCQWPETWADAWCSDYEWRNA